MVTITSPRYRFLTCSRVWNKTKDNKLSIDRLSTVVVDEELADHSIAVLRFDITGLGNSEGDFANTNFSSNVDDLILAATAMSDKQMSPSLLIGHSLGGLTQMR